MMGAPPQAARHRSSAEFTVPLCRGHHREVHRSGDEATWWGKAGIDPVLNARALWLKTHPLLITSDAKPRLTANRMVLFILAQFGFDGARGRLVAHRLHKS
jgi:hypothetical protein